MVRTEAQVRDIIFKYINFVNGKIKVDKVMKYFSKIAGVKESLTPAFTNCSPNHRLTPKWVTLIGI